MMHGPFPDRLLELLADREVGPLNAADRAELDALLAQHPDADDGSMAAAAVALMLGALGEVEEMPADLRSRIGASLAPASPALRITEAPAANPRAKPRANLAARLPVWSGWLAAAACLVVAVSIALTRSPATPPARLSVAEARERFLEGVDDVKQAAWGDWDNPEIPGVQGRVEWSESAQKGYMTFTGLRVNNPTEEQYQLWIIDERGMGQRISGAIFDCDTRTGECIVEIDPGIEVRNAGAFAVTIEQPEGVWVSDMSRRVVIAALNG
jgi:hypothetical protein